jgi:hypothetical protein
VAWLKEKQPKYRALRERSAQYLAREVPVAPEAVAALAVDELGLDTATAVTDVEDATDDDEEATPRSSAAAAPPPRAATPPAPRPGTQPRGRQQRRKKRR